MGTLSDDELTKIGRRFVAQWYPHVADGVVPTLGPIGNGQSARALSYRRYRNGVLMPMRLDVTISTTGRVMSATADLTPDPADMPTPVLSMAEAEQQAVQTHPGAHADKAFLLAKKVGEQ